MKTNQIKRTSWVCCLILLSAFVTLKKEEKLQDKFAYVPSGILKVGNDTFSLQAFYMQKTEVSNKEYQSFLNDLKRSGNTKDYELAKIDSNAWNFGNTLNEKLKAYYSNHPAYLDYPVVNVSYEGAMLYCAWLTKKWEKEYPNQKIIIRLPKREEIIRAGRMDSNLPYACGNTLSNSKGDVLANFVRFRNEEIHTNDSTKKIEIKPNFAHASSYSEDVLAPCKSYYPNLNGIYNLCGNAAEMTDIKGIAAGGSWRNTGYDIRLESVDSYEKANPKTGFRVVYTSLPKK